MINQQEYDWDVEAMARTMFEKTMSIKFAGGGTLRPPEAVQISARCIEAARIFTETLISTGLNTYQTDEPTLVEEDIPYPSAKEVEKQVERDNVDTTPQRETIEVEEPPISGQSYEAEHYQAATQRMKDNIPKKLKEVKDEERNQRA